MLKLNDKVQVKDGEERNPLHKDVLGIVKAVNGTTISVEFKDVDGVHQYETDELEFVKK